jgi:hypothetical protein
VGLRPLACGHCVCVCSNAARGNGSLSLVSVRLSGRGLCRADPSARGVLPNVVCQCDREAPTRRRRPTRAVEPGRRGGGGGAYKHEAEVPATPPSVPTTNCIALRVVAFLQCSHLLITAKRQLGASGYKAVNHFPHAS